MERIGIAASKIAKGSLLLYNFYVITISLLISLLLFLLAGIVVFLGLFIIRSLLGQFLPSMSQHLWDVIFSLSLIALDTPYNVPYLFTQTLYLTSYLASTTTKMIDVYIRGDKIINVLINKENLIATVTLFNPTYLVLTVSLIYALTSSLSKYGIENVKVFVKDKSLALIINVKDNSREIINKLSLYLDEVQKEVNKFLINSTIIGIVLFIGYVYLKKNL